MRLVLVTNGLDDDDDDEVNHVHLTRKGEREKNNNERQEGSFGQNVDPFQIAEMGGMAGSWVSWVWGVWIWIFVSYLSGKVDAA